MMQRLGEYCPVGPCYLAGTVCGNIAVNECLLTDTPAVKEWISKYCTKTDKIEMSWYSNEIKRVIETALNRKITHAAVIAAFRELGYDYVIWMPYRNDPVYAFNFRYTGYAGRLAFTHNQFSYLKTLERKDREQGVHR